MFEFLRIGKNPDELCDFFGSGEILAYLYTMQYMS